MLLIANGKTLFNKYVLEIKKKNQHIGVYSKKIKKKDEKGKDRWEKTYYYQKVKRSDEEIAELIKEGKDPKATSTNYKDIYIGANPPVGFEEDKLSILKKEGKIKFDQNNMIVDAETFELMKEVTTVFNDTSIYKIN
jgi:hypothetical protein